MKIKIPEKVWLLISAIIGVTVILVAAYVYRSEFGVYYSDKTEVWGQFGDFMNFFVSISNLMVITTLTWIVFAVQNTSDKAKEVALKKELIDQKIFYLNFLLSKSVEYSEDYVRRLGVFKNEIGDGTSGVPIFSINPDTEIRALTTKLNQEEYFHAYANSIKKTDIVKVFSALDVIVGNRDAFIVSLEEYKEFDYERRKICKECTEAAVSECVRYLTDLKRQNKKNTEDFIVINSSAVNYFNNLETNSSDMSIFREFLFKPVAELLNRNNRMQLVEYDVLRDLFQKANKSFTQITLSNKHLGEDSISYVGPINKAIEVVKEVLPELAEYVKK